LAQFLAYRTTLSSKIQQPRLLVLTTVFPSGAQPNVGLFVRERMFRVGRRLPLVVVVPQPWFPLQGLITRFWKPHFRLPAPFHEIQQGVEVYHPRFLSIPGFLKGWDGILMALCCFPLLLRLRKSFRFNVIDAHFAYPDGYAATLLANWLRVPATITLRGTEVPLSRYPARRVRMLKALRHARRVFSVSEALKSHVVAMGADADKIGVVGNGVDISKFHPVDRVEARRQLGLPEDANVLVSVGGLVERKGFHRVIDVLPRLLHRYPNLHYLIVGGASVEGDISMQLKEQVRNLGLCDQVHFLGSLAPGELKVPLSSADVFVLATRNEGWANVFLEAMACGLPVVTTDVGGNSEVVCREELGMIVPFGDAEALHDGLITALAKSWDRKLIVDYALENDWEKRVDVLVSEFQDVVASVDSMQRLDLPEAPSG
jgi:teichuronic acid biosynthesis glycosyltransferase TuaC